MLKHITLIIVGLLFCTIATLSQDSLNMHQVGQLTFGEDFGEVLYYQGYLYVAHGRAGLSILDVHDPTNPTLVNEVELNGISHHLLVKDEILFVTSVHDIFALDISDPVNPEYIGEHREYMFMMKDSWLRENYLYMANYWDREVVIFDVNDPENMFLVTQIPVPFLCKEVQVNDSLLIACGRDGDDLAIFRETTPFSYELISTWQTPPPRDNLAVIDLILYKHYLYARASELHILDISNPEDISFLNIYDHSPTSDIILKNDVLYSIVLGPPHEVWVTDLQFPDSPEMVGIYRGPGIYESLDTDETGRYIFVTTTMPIGQILVYDCTEAVGYTFNFEERGNRFQLVSSSLQPRFPTPEFLFGGLNSLVIAYQNNGDIYIPDFVNTIETIDPGQGYLVFNQNDEIFSQRGQHYEGPVTTHIPANRWFWLGYPYWEPLDVETALNFLFDEIAIILDDEGNFNIPYEISTLDSLRPGDGYYLFSYFDWDFTFPYPAEPDEEGVVVGNQYLPASSVGVTLPPTQSTVQKTGKPYLILVSLSEELRNLNPSGVKVYDGDLLVGDAIVDNQNPKIPVIAWQGDTEHGLAGFTPGTPIAIVIFDEQSEEIGRARGPQLFGKGPFAEIQIDAFDIDSQPLPETYLLATPYPNPFNATTSITIALPETAEISVKVYDILGSEVAVLYRGNLEAGRHQLQWSGNSDAGSSVSSGVYFVRMQTPVGVQTEKIVVMK